MITAEQMGQHHLGPEDTTILPITNGDQISFDPSTVDALKLETTIEVTDLYPPDKHGRVYIRTANGAAAAPVGILVHDATAERPYSYIDLSGERKPIEPGKEYPYLVKNWLKYVKGNTENEGLAYRDPLGREPNYEHNVNTDYKGRHRTAASRITKFARDLKREIDSTEPWSALIKERPNPRYRIRVEDSQPQKPAEHATAKPEVSLSQRVRNVARQLGQTVSRFWIRPRVRGTGTGELVGPVVRQEYLDFPMASVLNELGDPHIHSAQDFVDAALKDPEEAAQKIKRLRVALIMPLNSRINREYPDPDAMEAAKRINDALTRLELRSGLVKTSLIREPGDVPPAGS